MSLLNNAKMKWIPSKLAVSLLHSFLFCGQKNGLLLWMIIHLIWPTLLLRSNISFKNSAVCFCTEKTWNLSPLLEREGTFQDEQLTVRQRCIWAHGYCLNSDLSKGKASLVSIRQDKTRYTKMFPSQNLRAFFSFLWWLETSEKEFDRNQVRNQDLKSL